MRTQSSMLLQTLCLLIVSVSSIQDVDLEDYHSYENMTSVLKKWNDTTSNSALSWNLYSIGQSVMGLDLWVFEISAAPKNISGIPNMKYIGNMHRKYEVSREILLRFIEHLMSSYGKDENVTHLLDTTRLHVLPNMNPDIQDKFELENAVGIDLNTNFPDFYHPNKQPIQPETKAIMNWMTKIPFVLSASIDGSAVVANYPLNSLQVYDSFVKEQKESLTKDNDVFVHLAKLYSNNHAYMHTGKKCPANDYYEHPRYPGGITNGAKTNSLTNGHIGSMQDYNYFKHGCMELNVMIACSHVETDELAKYWNDSKNALIQYALEANRGVYGIIKDSSTQQPLEARLTIGGRNMEFNTTRDGEFWRILLPGKYYLTVSSDGYYKKTVQFAISDTGRFPELLHLEVLLLNDTVTTTSATVESQSMAEDTRSSIASVGDNDLDDGVMEPQIAEQRSSANTHHIISLSLFIICVLGRHAR